jgi:hypothetical protein
MACRLLFRHAADFITTFKKTVVNRRLTVAPEKAMGRDLRKHFLEGIFSTVVRLSFDDWELRGPKQVAAFN